jgi:hypothetical protein
MYARLADTVKISIVGDAVFSGFLRLDLETQLGMVGNRGGVNRRGNTANDLAVMLAHGLKKKPLERFAKPVFAVIGVHANKVDVSFSGLGFG